MLPTRRLGIAHVMETVQEQDEIVAPGKLGRARDLEAHRVGQARRTGTLLRPCDRAGVVVEAHDLAGRIGLREQQR